MGRFIGGIGPKRTISQGTASSYSGIWDLSIQQKERGESNWSVLPGAPTSLTTSSATSSTITVSFTQPSDSGNISNYEYSLSTNGGVSFGAFAALSPADATSPVTISGLSSSTNYQVKLRAVNQFGKGPESNAASFATGSPAPSSVEYLVIAGGGGGGTGSDGFYNGGGGGAGGYRSSVSGESSGGGASAESTITLTANTYTVTVGAGGASSTSGSNSSLSGTGITTITSTGGGRGASNVAAQSGGSGGGGAGPLYGASFQGYAGGTPNQGYRGGDGYGESFGGGGGGASEVGNTNGQGYGGDGVSSSITGSSVVRAGGGGGGSQLSAYRLGGSGGGGNGGAIGGGAQGGFAGTANTGGGGGGAAAGPGGAGGKGVVIIRYLDSFGLAVATTGSPSYINTGGYHIYVFNASGSITF